MSAFVTTKLSSVDGVSPCSFAISTLFHFRILSSTFRISNFSVIESAFLCFVAMLVGRRVNYNQQWESAAELERVRKQRKHVHSTIATTTRCQLMTLAPSCGRWRYVGWGVLRAEHMVALILFAGRAMLIRLRGVQRKYSRWATVRFLNSVTINYRTSHTDLPFHTSILFACQT